MTTARQVQKLVKPLLARHADLVLVRRLLVITPLGHILRGVYLDATSSADICDPKWFVTTLSDPHAGIMFNWGEQLYPPFKGLWRLSDPRTSTALCETIESVALPLLRPMRTIEHFVGFATKERFPWTPFASYKRRKLYVDLALGDFESARILCAHFQRQLSYEPRRLQDWEVEDYSYIVDVLAPLVEAEDKIGIARLLHDLELSAVKREKLDHLWQPTPFPIEMA